MRTDKLILKILFVCLSGVILISGGCVRSGDDGDRLKFTGAQAYGLQGPVKTVRNETTGETMVFNRLGNIESIVSPEGSRTTYVYEGPSRYKSGDMKYRIECPGDTLRMINEAYEEIFGFENEYRFDDRGRVISYTYFEGMMGVVIEYSYMGDSRLPYKEVESSQDEYGDWSTTTEYVYADIDSYGNWTKRIGTSRSVTNDYEEVMNGKGEWTSETTTTKYADKNEETRRITYY